MKSVIMPIILQVAGFIVVFAEIFIPSGGILALCAAGLFGYSFFIAFTDISTTAGIYFIAVDIMGLPFSIYFGIKLLDKSPATLKQTLSSQQGVSSQNPVLKSFINQKGEALADLRPSGPALINKQRIDVVSRGEYITKGSEIIVISAIGNQIVVKENSKGENG